MKFTLATFLALFISFSLSAQQGTLRGSMYDKENGETLLYANILINETGGGTTTDLEGAYSLDLDPGVYTVTYSYVGFADYVVEGVEIIAGEVAIIDANLGVEGELLKEVVVTATQARSSVAALATLKRKSSNLIDGISSASFKKIGDSNAAAAVKRVSGVSVEGGKYVYVRGLGDRYTKSIMNGIDIPGLDPDRNTLQMDIFPTNIIDNIIVLKSFTADLPADFTGGVVNINTKDFPEEKSSSISLGIGFNPSMHFNDNYLSYEGSGTDFLGFDSGSRAIPTDRATNIATRGGVFANPDDQSRFNQVLDGFSPTLAGMRNTSFMDYNLGYTLGNQVNKGNYTLGYNLALTYKNSTDYYENAVYSRYGKGNTSDILELDRRELQEGDFGTNNVLLGGLGGLSLKTKKSKYTLNLLRLQNGESTAGLFNYVGSDQGANFTADQHNLEYGQRSITNVMLNGVHTFGESSNWNLDWKLSPTFSSITDPDIRFTRIRKDGDELSIGTESGIPQRIWRYLNEVNYAGKVDLEKKFTFRDAVAKLKFGTAYTRKDRDYEIQNFGIFVGNTEVTADPNTLFDQENYFSLENAQGLYYQPNFIPRNSNKFDANTNMLAGYVSTELDLFKSLKAVVGVRVESFNQNYTGFNQSGEAFDNERVIEDVDVFPTANFIYALGQKQNLRVSLAKTIARPSFKEASFATIIDPLSGRTFIGGFFPDIDVATEEVIWDGNLQSTDIINADLRYEIFGDRGQNVSVSTFFKSFANPIEIVQYVQAANNFQPRNVGDGQILGVELEFRKNLGDLGTTLGNIAVNGNVTVVKSQIEMSQTEFNSRVNNARDGEVIDNVRDMAGQAPYLVNAGLSYGDAAKGFDIGAFYNVSGKTLQFVGIADRPDVYTVPFHSVNITAKKAFGDRLNVRLKADNILNAKRESEFESFGAENQLFQSLSPQRSFSVSIGYDLR